MTQIDDRALRVIVGALLGSELKRADLHRIADRFARDSRWAGMLAEALHEAAELSRLRTRPGRQKALFPGQPMSDELAEETHQLLSRKRLPKLEALSILEHAARGSKWRARPDETLRENVILFFDALRDPHEALEATHRVREMLGLGGDEYFRTIVDRP